VSARTAQDALAQLPYPLHLLVWVDSSHMGEGWVDFDQLDAGQDRLLCVTVGFVVQETRHAKLLVPSIADLQEPGNRQAHGSMLIPKSAILAERVLRRAP
jgi:hypothetical protein